MAECQVAIVNGRMRSLKRLIRAGAMSSWAIRCDSEWPYEVTETLHHPPLLFLLLRVAIVNGRMRSLKHVYTWASRLHPPWVAIVNGRMRSLKLAMYTSLICSREACCDSEWPYEVTETFNAAPDQRGADRVAIVNGRMRSLKPRAPELIARIRGMLR